MTNTTAYVVKIMIVLGKNGIPAVFGVCTATRLTRIN